MLILEVRKVQLCDPIIRVDEGIKNFFLLVYRFHVNTFWLIFLLNCESISKYHFLCSFIANMRLNDTHLIQNLCRKVTTASLIFHFKQIYFVQQQC